VLVAGKWPVLFAVYVFDLVGVEIRKRSEMAQWELSPPF